MQRLSLLLTPAHIWLLCPSYSYKWLSFLLPFLALYLFSFTQKPAVSEASCPCSQTAPPCRSSGTGPLKGRTCSCLLACSPSGMAWNHPRQTQGPFTPAGGAKACSSQKRGELATGGLRLFARDHTHCKPQLTLERHLI